MRTKPISVRSRVDGKSVPATLLLCSKCGRDAFIVYLIGIGTDPGHPHLQCRGCGETFCQGGCPSPDEVFKAT